MGKPTEGLHQKIQSPHEKTVENVFFGVIIFFGQINVFILDAPVGNTCQYFITQKRMAGEFSGYA
jgi:hypothetical protein